MKSILALALLACTSASLRANEPPLALLSGSDLKANWRVVDEMKDHGEVSLTEGVLRLNAGKPTTGVALIEIYELP